MDFWFDPVCPYTWIASRWLLEVADLRPIEICWQLMSLTMLNEGRADDPEGEWGDYMARPVRVCAAVEQAHGQSGLESFYTALGERIHHEGRWDAIELALADAELPTTLARAAEDTALDAIVRRSHDEAVAMVGSDLGSPVIAVPDADDARIAFYGPVVAPIPRGDDALLLWDAIVALAHVPGFAELKRTADLLADPPLS
ncbi:MAG TPA: disulfide bond formation protein DsbA [Euzebya sp.]|nr:disulfide bond formation protein DsbA [Euzebya sp.]